MISPFSSPFRSPFQPPGTERYGGLTLPRTGLVMLIRRDSATGQMVDIISESSRPNQKRKFGIFNGTGDYVPLPSTVTLVGDFEFSVKCYPTASNGFLVSGGTGVGGIELYIDGATGNPLGVFLGGTKVITSTKLVVLNAACTLNMRRVSGVISCGINGEYDVVNTHTYAGNVVISTLGARTGGTYKYTGRAWNFICSDSTGSKFNFSHATKNGSTSAIWFDRSGNGLHSTATIASIDAHCGEGLRYGSNSLELEGFSTGGGGYAETVLIPLLVSLAIDCLGNTPTYTGRAKYNFVFTAGDGSDLTNSSFKMPETGELYDLNASLGSIMFDGSDAAIARSYADWVDNTNVNKTLLWIGPAASLCYTTTPANISAVKRYVGLSTYVPPWVPSGAVLHADFINDQYYWDDREKDVSRLTAVAGGYYLDFATTPGDDCWLVIEAQFDQDAPPSGTVFSWTSGYPAGNRLELDAYLAGDYRLRAYVNPLSGGGGDYQVLPVKSKAIDEGTVYLGNGVYRVIASLSKNVVMQAQSNNGEIITLVRARGDFAATSRIAFQCRAWANGAPDNVASGVTLRRVSIINSALTEAAVDAISINAGGVLPVHFIGDSGLNNYMLLSRVNALSSVYVPYSQDGVGGTTITQQAVRFATNKAKWHNSTLVIVDFGRDGTASEAIAAIDSMVALLSHDRWIYVQPAPFGTAGYAQWEADNATIAAHCGSHYVETLPTIQAAGDDSPEDNAEIAIGLWPLSLRIGPTDYHANDAGNDVLAGIIHAALQSRSWIP